MRGGSGAGQRLQQKLRSQVVNAIVVSDGGPADKPRPAVANSQCQSVLLAQWVSSDQRASRHEDSHSRQDPSRAQQTVRLALPC